MKAPTAPKAVVRAPTTSRVTSAATRTKPARTGSGPIRTAPKPVRTGRRERAAAGRHRIWVRLGVVAGALALIAAAVWVVGFSPWLALKADRIEIVGASQTVPDAAVRPTLEAAVGTPLARLDFGAIGGQLVTIPGVRSVTLTRDWPNGITAHLVTREPVAQVARDDGIELVDDEGVAVGTALEPVAGLPTLDVPGDADTRTVAAALAVAAALPEDLRAETATVGAASPVAVFFDLSSGQRVEWGAPGDTEVKVAALAVLRANTSASVFDLSSPTAPITR